MSPLASYTLRRLAQTVPVIALIMLGNFLLLKAVPGDLVDVIAGEGGAASQEYMDMLRAQFGLDRPDWVQFLSYAAQLAHFDLGYSFRHNMPVSQLILDRLPATLLLIGTSIALAVGAGLLLGALAARFRGGLVDQAVSVFAAVVFAMPVFWIGLMAIVLFAVELRWFPIGGMTQIGGAPSALGTVGDVAFHLMLPATTLSLAYLALYARVTRAAMGEVYDLDYVRTARAKGISEARIAVRHVLRNALLPVVTLLGLQLGSVLGGAVVVETVFSWPGMGRLAFEAVGDRDINLLLSLFLCNSLLVIIMSLAVDLIYGVLDPRVELVS